MSSFKIFSITEISVDVVSNPQKAAQSLQTIPDPITSLPLLIVPAQSGTYNKLDNSSSSLNLVIYTSTVVKGWTIPPLLLN